MKDRAKHSDKMAPTAYLKTKILYMNNHKLLLLLFAFLMFSSPLRGICAEDPLSPEERAWLKQHDGKIVVNREAGWPPIIDTGKDGNSFGIVMDYQNMLEEKLGFKFKPDKLDSWENFMDRFRKWEIDVNNNLQKNPKRTKYAFFTEPYIKIPNAIIVRKDFKDHLTLDRMRGMKIAVTNDFAIHDFIKNRYGYLELKPLGSDLNCLLETSTRSVDAAVVNLAVASFIIEKMGITNLRVAGYADYENDLCFASRKDWPILNRILNKGLGLITPAERTAIYRKWISLGHVPFYKHRKFWVITGSAAAIIFALILMILFWNRSLKKQVGIRTEKLEKTNVELKNQIAERKQAEIALRESERKYRRIFDNIQDVYFETSLDGTILQISPSVVKISKYKREELIGKSVYDIYTNAKERDAFLEEILMKGKVNNFEIALKDRDGLTRLCSITTLLIKDEEGNPLKLVGSMRDISERRKGEKEKKNLEDKLQRAQKMEAIGLLAGGVAHDLNNILSGIVSYPELLLMDLPENSPLKKPIRTIQESGQRAANVVADLLTMAKGVAIGKEVLNLNTVVTQYLESLECLKLKEYHARIKFSVGLDPLLLNIKGSPIHIQKSVMNLIINASEAIEKSGTVTITSMNRHLDQPLMAYEEISAGEYAVLCVSDNGSGISAEDLERIFEPFYTKKVMGSSGTGLGLSIVWNTLHELDGYIDVKSGRRGTTFELYFPVFRGEPVDPEETHHMEDFLGHGEKILVVDDEEGQRDIALGMLEKLGYDADSVSSGEEAVTYFKENRADLVVLDMIMPKGINGFEAYEQITRIRPEQKAIIASGFSETEHVLAAQKLGAGKYIKKPYTLKTFGLAIKEELKNRVIARAHPSKGQSKYTNAGHSPD